MYGFYDSIKMGLFRPFIPKSVNLGDQVQTALAQQKREPWPYIYVMYIYGCNAILTTSMNNIIDKEMIQEFTELTEDLKIRRINPGFHFMDNETYTTFKMIMTFMNIKYQSKIISKRSQLLSPSTPLNPQQHTKPWSYLQKKKLLRNTVHAFKKTKLDINYFFSRSR